MKKALLLILIITRSSFFFAQCVYEWGTTATYNRQADFISKDHLGNLVTIEGESSSLFITKRTSSGTILFSKGISANTRIIAWDFFVDVNNNIYVTGSFSGSLHFGSTTLYYDYDVCSQAFVLKLDSDGDLIWIKASTGNSGSSADGDDLGMSVSADSAGNCYLAGYYDSGFILDSHDFSLPLGSYSDFTAKLDAVTGSLIWFKKNTLGSTVPYVPITKACKNGDFYQVANFSYTSILDSTEIMPASVLYGNNICVVMRNKDEHLKWYLTSTAGQGSVRAATMDSHENLIFVGIMQTVPDSLGFGADKIYNTHLGVFYVKVDTSGNILDLKRIVSSDDSVNFDIAKCGLDVDSSNNVYLSGSLDHNVDFNGISTTGITPGYGSHFYVTKYNDTLNPLWNSTFGASTDFAYIYGAVKVENKNVFAAGSFFNNIVIDSISFDFGISSGGGYFAELCDQNGNTDSIPVPVSTANIHNRNISKIKIYPNPASTSLYIEQGATLQYKNFEIYDSSGRLICTVNGNHNKIELDPELFTNGLYLIRITFNDNHTEGLRFIVNN